MKGSPLETRTNPHSPQPLYTQVKEAIMDYVQENSLSSNALLPSEREFGELFSVSRVTIRRAIDQLVKEGYVFRLPGKGTFVGLKKIQQRLRVMTSFTKAMGQEGHIPGTHLLEMTKENPGVSVCKHLEVETTDPVLKIRRLRSVDRLPFSIATSYMLHESVKALREEDLAMYSLYSLLEEKCGIKLAKNRATLEVTMADYAEAALLEIKAKDPVFLMKGTISDDRGQVVEYYKAIYRGDRLKFITESD